MSFEIVFVLVLVAVTILLFITEKLPVDLVALMVMATLLVSQIISLEEGISGFSNTATVTVGAMFVLSAGLFKTGALNVVGAKLAIIGRRSFPLALLSMMLVVGFVSAFINNTTTVAVFMPVVLDVAREAKVSPSKLLMPLSFASMFGGICTLIGTSTNILVNSIAERHGIASFGMFEFTTVGVILFAFGIVFMMTVGIRLIPGSREGADLTQNFGMRHYLTEIVLLPEAKSIGKTIADSPLVHELDIDILEVFRGGERLLLPTPEVTLQEYDILRVRADVRKIKKIQKREGILIKSGTRWGDKVLQSGEAILVEAVVAPHSVLEGKSLATIQFRERFSAAPLAIRHRGKIRHEKLETTPLRAGDAILIEIKKYRVERLRQHPAFVFITEVEFPKFRKSKTWRAFGIVFGVVLASALNLLPITVGAIVGAVLMVLVGCLTLEEAYAAIDWKVIFLLAGLLTLGIAIEKSGAAAMMADFFISFVGPWGPTALLSTFFFVTMMLTNVMSNNATAALLAPIAIVTALSQGWSPRPFLVAVMFGASLSFMTPVGYQTNTLIYGPGQYKFSDFMRVGTPLNLLFWVLATWMIPQIWPF